MNDWQKPFPSESGETRPFWQACQENRYLLQKCRDCGRVQAYYRGFCAHCWSPNIDDLASAGAGSVWTYTVTHQNRTPGFSQQVPYVLALIALEEGVRVFANVINCDPASVSIGMAVRVAFVDTGKGKVPMFEPA